MKFVPVSSTQRRAVTPEQNVCTVESISEAYEGLLASYMGLSDALRNLDEVCQVMENIALSIQMIETGGMDAVKLLNVDKSMESLLGVAEEKFTVEAATEGFTEAFKEAWAKFKEWCRKAWKWIVDFFTNNAARNKELDAQIESIKKQLNSTVSRENLYNILDSGVNVKFNITPSYINEMENELYGLLKGARESFERNSKLMKEMDTNAKDLSEGDMLKKIFENGMSDIHLAFQKFINHHFNQEISMKTWREHGYTSGSQVLTTLDRISNMLDHIDSDYNQSGFLKSHLEGLNSKVEDSTLQKRINGDDSEMSKTAIVIRLLKTSVRECTNVTTDIANVCSILSRNLSILNANLIRQFATQRAPK